MTNQTVIPCVLMRGGTSKGPYFLASDLPADSATRDRVLLTVMGSPDTRQIDGIGGATPLTSKVAIVGPSERDDCDVDYLFAQVSIERPIVDTSPTCGNILVGVGPFAVEEGLVSAMDGQTTVRIHSVNTSSTVEAVVQTPGGVVAYDGDVSIDGAPGAAAPVVLRFREAAGSKTGALLPTGAAREDIDGVPVTCMDVAMPMVLMRAVDLGKSGYETKAELDKDTPLLERLQAVRREAGRRMGLGDVTDKVIPKIGFLAAPRRGGAISSRYFVPHECHAAHAVTGALCVATCAVMQGTVADGLSTVKRTPVERIVIEHPAGQLEVELSVRGHDPGLEFGYGGVVRTARRLFQGQVLVPASVWDGRA